MIPPWLRLAVYVLTWVLWLGAYWFLWQAAKNWRRRAERAERHRDNYRERLAAVVELAEVDDNWSNPGKDPDAYAALFQAQETLRDPDEKRLQEWANPQRVKESE